MDFWRWGSSGAQAILGVVASGLVFYLFRVYWRLRHIPGPFWAKFSDVQRVLWVTTRNAHVFHQRAHERYGDAVRFGPNMVSLADPAWIPTVYPIRPGFPKASLLAMFW
jgi:hypothetical protein